MSVSVEVPSLGESVSQGYIAEWKKSEGDYIAEDDVLCELETDKITITVPAPVSGTISALKADIDDAVDVGESIAEIEPGDAPADAAEDDAAGDDDSTRDEQDRDKQDQAQQGGDAEAGSTDGLSPAVARLVEQHDVDPAAVEATGPGGRLLKGDVLAYLDKDDADAHAGTSSDDTAATGIEVQRGGQSDSGQSDSGQPDIVQREDRHKMSRLRQTIASRLVDAQHEAAMLTTFQEADMSGVMELRSKYKQKFVDKYGIKLGFMSFFVKAAIEALKEYPAVNAEIDGDELVYKNYYNIGVAVGGGDKGLVVPVIQNADQLSFADVELTINELVRKVHENTLTMADLQDGTFSITNGGIYGSMLSTPILNPPQSGILGMHNIVERPVAVDGEVEIRPIMYLALSYDHRVIDGREAVSFLKRLQELIENPERILLEI